MTRWYALTEVPQPIRDTMALVWAQWDTRDLTLDGTLAMVHEDRLAAQQVGVLSRALANRSRVPRLCDAVRDAHAISMRSTWRAVGLFLGLHPSHVQRLCYRRPK